MKKLLFVLAVALSACNGSSTGEVVSNDSTSVSIDTIKSIDSIKVIDSSIIDTLKK
jgi:uncharacterized protein YcfL